MWFPTSGILVSSHRNDGSLFSGTAVSKTPDTGVTEAGIFTSALAKAEVTSLEEANDFIDEWLVENPDEER